VQGVLGLAVAGLLTLLVLISPGAATVELPALFAALWAWRRKRGPAFSWPRSVPVRAGLVFFFSGLGLELFPWLGSYSTRDIQPRLMHPQLGPDLVLSLGFYGGMACGWALLLRRWAFSVRAAYGTVGLWGLAVEQQGKALLVVLAAPPTAPLQALLLAIQVFAVYGAVGGIAQLLASPDDARPGRRLAWIKYPCAMVLLAIGAFLGTAIVALASKGFGGLPLPGPIRERPFW
jgi:hypothetical protein